MRRREEVLYRYAFDHKEWEQNEQSEHLHIGKLAVVLLIDNYLPRSYIYMVHNSYNVG